ALLASRCDLAGLPFLKGDACRMSEGVSREHASLTLLMQNSTRRLIIGCADGSTQEVSDEEPEPPTPEQLTHDSGIAWAAFWMQISPEDQAKRKRLVNTIARFNHPAATLALGKLAVFA